MGEEGGRIFTYNMGREGGSVGLGRVQGCRVLGGERFPQGVQLPRPLV